MCSDLLRTPLLALAFALAGNAPAQPVAGAAVATPLRAVIATAQAMPYAQLQGEQAVGGFTLQLYRAIAQRLGRPLETVLLPRQRLEGAAQAGDYELRCQFEPLGTAQSPAYSWSAPLLSGSDLLVGHRDAAAVQSLDELAPGQPIGTVNGYAYPVLEPLLATGRLRRDDALTEERALRKLALNRPAYAAVESRALAWQRQHGTDAIGAPWRLPLGRLQYLCAVPQAGRTAAAPLLAAIEELRAGGQVARIAAAELPPREIVVVAAAGSRLAPLDREALVALYMGQRPVGVDGAPSRLLAQRGELRDSFHAQVLRRDAAQIRMAWSQLVFSGRAKAPLELTSTAELRERLLADPQAIGYMDVADVDERLRILFAQ